MDTHGVADAAALGMAAGIRSTLPLAALSLTLPRRRLYGAPLALSIALGASTGAVAALASTFLFHRVPAAISGDLLAIGTSTAATRRLRRAR